MSDQSDFNSLEHKTPQRRCVCCRCNDKKGLLLRFALFQNTLCFDLRHKLPGRGFYVCAQRACLDKAFANGLKRISKHDASEIAPSVDAFVDSLLLPSLNKRIQELLLAGFRSHQLLLGADTVEQAAREDALMAYIVATDASPSTLQKYRTNAERKNIPCVSFLERSAYGQMFGKSDKVVLGWLECNLGRQFLAHVRALKNLKPEG